MGLQIEEQETHISFMRGDQRAIIYTSDTTMMTKFNKLVEIAMKNVIRSDSGCPLPQG